MVFERTRRIFFALMVAAAAAACSSSTSPTTASPPSDVTGTWKGNFSIAGTSAPMTWTLTQNGTNVTGPILVELPNGVVLLNGSLTGTLSGTTLTYAIAVGPGGIPSEPSCTGQLRGTLDATFGTTSTLVGNYAIASSTCTPPFGSSGNISLNR